MSEKPDDTSSGLFGLWGAALEEENRRLRHFIYRLASAGPEERNAQLNDLKAALGIPSKKREGRAKGGRPRKYKRTPEELRALFEKVRIGLEAKTGRKVSMRQAILRCFIENRPPPPARDIGKHAEWEDQRDKFLRRTENRIIVKKASKKPG